MTARDPAPSDAAAAPPEAAGAGAVRELAMTARTTFSDPSVSVTELTVECPRRGQPVSLRECFRCAHCRGVIAGDEHRLRCEATAPQGDQEAAPVDTPAGFDPLTSDNPPLAQLMRDQTLCVAPELSVASLAALFTQHGISGAPVVDPDGRPLGLVSKTDLVRECADGASRSVREIMTPRVLSLPENARLGEACALMTAQSIHRVAVVGPTGRVIGLLSSLDVVRWLSARHGWLHAEGSAHEP